MNATNGDHDHDENDEGEAEISITFHLREEELVKLGLTTSQCETALLDALEAHDALEPDDAPAFEDIVLEIADQRVRLGDIADIEMTTTFDELDGEDLDDDDDDVEWEEDDEELVDDESDEAGDEGKKA